MSKKAIEARLEKVRADERAAAAKRLQDFTIGHVIAARPMALRNIWLNALNACAPSVQANQMLALGTSTECGRAICAMIDKGQELMHLMSLSEAQRDVAQAVMREACVILFG